MPTARAGNGRPRGWFMGVVREMVERYGCDGFQDITVEKGEDYAVVRLHAWDGTVFVLKVVDARIVRPWGGGGLFG